MRTKPLEEGANFEADLPQVLINEITIKRFSLQKILIYGL